MAMVGNKTGHCYGMCSKIVDTMLHEWRGEGSTLGGAIAAYVKENGKLRMWAAECEKIQKSAVITADRSSSLHVTLIDNGLGHKFNSLPVLSGELVPDFAQMMTELVAKTRIHEVFPINPKNPSVYLFLIDYRLPTIANNAMVNGGHAILIGFDTQNTGMWRNLAVFDPNRGVMEFDLVGKNELNGWWIEYMRSYKGMGRLEAVNVFDRNVLI